MQTTSGRYSVAASNGIRTVFGWWMSFDVSPLLFLGPNTTVAHLHAHKAIGHHPLAGFVEMIGHYADGCVVVRARSGFAAAKKYTKAR